MGAIFSAAWRNSIVCVLLLIAADSFAAEPDVAPGWSALHWSVEDGLPVNSINQITQDENGYIWLATMDGLVRFDGQKFKVYDSGSHAGLASNRLTRLEHADGDLWLLSEDNRLVSYAGGAFRRFGVDDGLPDARVTVLERIDGVWWAGTTSGAAWWDGVRFQALDAARWPHYTQAILGDADGTVWLASRSGSLARWQAGRLEIVAEIGQPIWALASDPADGVWLGHRSGASLWRDGEMQPLEVSPDALNDVIRIEFGPDGSQYLHGSVTLYRYRDGRLEVLTEALYRSGSEPMLLELPGTDEFLINLGTELRKAGERILAIPTRIDDLLVDREDNVWVATAGAGLYRLRTNSLSHYLDHPQLGSAPTYPITTDRQGRIWVGTGGAGLFILDASGQLLDDPGAEQPMDMIYSLLPPDEPGAPAWIGGLGLHRWHEGEFSQDGVPPELSLAMVYALYRDRDGTVWAGTHNNGLWRTDAGRWHKVSMPERLTNPRVRVMLEDRSGVLWMGTNGNGLLRRDGENFERIGLRRGMPSLLVRALHLDAHGHVWVGTETHGLCRVGNPGAQADALDISCINRSHGLFHHGIHQILDDDLGNLTLSSNRGIFMAEKSALETALDAVAAGRSGRLLGPATFLEVDGLPNREANGGVQSAGTVGPDGRLWFPTMSGPVVIDSGRIGRYRVEPAAIIESVRTEDRSWSSEAAPIELPAGVRDVGFDFTAPSFVSPRNLQFEYRLNGYEEDWRDPIARTQVEYTNLPHGDYRFEVRAGLGGGARGAVTAQAFSIPPRFFEQLSFYGLALFVLLAFIICAWRIREKHNEAERARLKTVVEDRTAELNHEKSQAVLARDEIARQAEHLRSLDREKRAFFANISHELRTPLTLLLGPLDQYQDDPEKLAEQAHLMRRNARRLNRLVEQLLDLQRIEGGQLQIFPELHELVGWMESLIELFRPLAEQRDITIELERPEQGLRAWFDREQMEKILGNLLSNAIRYCRPGDRICIKLSRIEETACIRVEDTGPGIPAHHLPNLFERFYRAVESNSPIEGTGIGLALSRDLIQLHGGDIVVESEDDDKATTGTSFTLHWPARATAGDPDRARAPAQQDGEQPGGAPAEEPSSHDRAGYDRAGHDRTADRSTARSEDAPGEEVKRLLVVDDNADIRQWLRRSLGGEFSVVTARDGVQALDCLDQALPDLVISDWMMPNMDGIELLGELEKRAEFAGIPVIMLTARGDIGDRIGAYHAGAVAYVAKPFNNDILRAQIDSILEQQQRLRKRLAEDAAAGRNRAPAEIVESRFARQAAEIIDANMHDPGFGVEQLAAELNMDRSVLFRKTREELSIKPSELLREQRLRVAHDLLCRREGAVSEVAYAVGFGSIDGFSRAFRRKYGTSPSRLDTAPARPATARATTAENY